VRAAFRTTYGLPDVLSIKELPKPIPKEDEVLIRVHATTVNRSDYHALTGKPFIMKFFTGFLTPKLSVTGSDFAGQIEAIGGNVKQFKIGDKVMGFIDLGAQSHAEYLSIPESKVTVAPNNVTYEQAVACLEGAFYALCAIQPIKLEAGQKALVIGATGAIGSSYVQFLKHYGVEVTAVCGGENSSLVQSLGAAKIIDFKTTDFRKTSDFCV
jgi:NADPH:quinone reductase-like Zn-dependent oxidoreductase